MRNAPSRLLLQKCDEICYELSHCAAKLTMLVQESTKLQDDALPLYQLVVGFKSSHPRFILGCQKVFG